jgi:hypothetical protein
MKITPTLLSIPPYLSTTWESIESLYVNGEGALVVLLKSRMQAEIPNLSEKEIEEIFEARARFGASLFSEEGALATEVPIPTPIQHDPHQSQSDDLPHDFIERITAISKALGLGTRLPAPRPVEGCNCPFCQVARAMHPEERVEDEELTFRSWDILEISPKLYTVSNPGSKGEQFSVFLGDPIGCTCGEKNCEHLKAVLNS